MEHDYELGRQLRRLLSEKNELGINAKLITAYLLDILGNDQTLLNPISDCFCRFSLASFVSKTPAHAMAHRDAILGAIGEQYSASVVHRMNAVLNGFLDLDGDFEGNAPKAYPGLPSRADVFAAQIPVSTNISNHTSGRSNAFPALMLLLGASLGVGAFLITRHSQPIRGNNEAPRESISDHKPHMQTASRVTAADRTMSQITEIEPPAPPQLTSSSATQSNRKLPIIQNGAQQCTFNQKSEPCNLTVSSLRSGRALDVSTVWLSDGKAVVYRLLANGDAHIVEDNGRLTRARWTNEGGDGAGVKIISERGNVTVFPQ